MIKTLLRCSKGPRLATKKPPLARDGQFYLRFYGVMRAMQQSSPSDIVCSKSRSLRTIHGSVSIREGQRPKGGERVPTPFERQIARIADSMLSLDLSQRHRQRRLEALYQKRGDWRRQVRHGYTEKERMDVQLQQLDAEIAALRAALLKPPPRDLTGIVQTPNYALDGIVSRALDGHVQDLLREPRQRQLQSLAHLLSTSTEPPSVKTFNIMISRLTRLRQNTAAWIVFQSMLKLGYRPDEYTVACVLNLCILTGSYLDFRKVLAAVRLQQAGPYRKPRKLLFFSTAIKGFVKFGHLRHAETYYKLMQAEAVHPTAVVLTCMLQGFAAQKQWEAGRLYFEELVHMPWDRLTVVALLRLCKACDQPAAEARIRVLASRKGVQTSLPGEDLAVRPVGWKTKGLDVPDRMKLPGPGDIGLRRKVQFSKTRGEEPQARGKVWQHWHHGSWTSRKT